MAKHDLIKKQDKDFAAQMQMFKNAVGPHAAKLGLTPEQVAGQAADADYFNYVVTAHYSLRASMRSWTAGKKSLRHGVTAETVPDKVMELLPPTLSNPPPAVAPGIEKRFRALVRHIKAGASYTVGVGKELSIEAVDHVAPDFATLQPVIAARIISGHVKIDWDWQGKRAFLDLCEIQVDRGDGRGFVPLGFDTTPGYMDPTPLPEQPTRWIYRALYHKGDAAVGQWSAPVSVLVSG